MIKTFIRLISTEMLQYGFDVMKVPTITELTSLSASMQLMINFGLREMACIVHSVGRFTPLITNSRDTTRHVCTMYETFDNRAMELVARIIIGTGKVRYMRSIFLNIRSRMRRKCESCTNA